ncbi:hypothetical protein ACFU7T_12105 [Streptomyces sp. NPDC057555]|uniref:hypothetical protein n=1 Tax=Streptomyces sp. NPDC057555 TaxID=3346166 RepID=UPI0036CD28D2
MMRNWETGKVILAKVIRQKTFILGLSTVLEWRAIALFDTGEVAVLSKRRNGSCVVERLWADQFELPVERLRFFERRYTTEELPEWRAVGNGDAVSV